MTDHQDQVERLVRIETLLDDLHHTLMGNGQPGKIADLDKDIAELKETHQKIKGAIWIMGILFTIAVTALQLWGSRHQ